MDERSNEHAAQKPVLPANLSAILVPSLERVGTESRLGRYLKVGNCTCNLGPSERCERVYRKLPLILVPVFASSATCTSTLPLHILYSSPVEPQRSSPRLSLH